MSERNMIKQNAELMKRIAKLKAEKEKFEKTLKIRHDGWTEIMERVAKLHDKERKKWAEEKSKLEAQRKDFQKNAEKFAAEKKELERKLNRQA